MGGQKFQYDESGGTFFYFLLSFLALLLIPGTFYWWPRDYKTNPESSSKECQCENCKKKKVILQTNQPWKGTKQFLTKLLIISGWIVLLLLAYKVSQFDYEYANFDPYEILGVPLGSSQSEIKRAYRKLSLLLHPDKETGDEKAFMKLTKAYQALTDDEARRNWEKYGNPDGPGAMSFGIALPSWIVEKENSVWVLGLYALVFMVALPTVVGMWWYKSIRYSGDQVLLETTQMYFYFFHKTPSMVLKRVIMILAASFEFERKHNSEVVERSTDNIEVPQLIKLLPNLSEKNREKPLCFIYSIKARAIIHAHFSRIPLNEETLEKDRQLIIKKCPYLLQEMVSCVSQLVLLGYARRVPRVPNIETIENCMKLSPMIVQGLLGTKSPLLQLPHVTEESLKYFTGKKRHIKTVQQFAQLPKIERRNILKHLSDEQFSDVEKVLIQMPFIDFQYKSEVVDDETPHVYTAGAIVTVTVTLTRHSLLRYYENETEDNEIEDNNIEVIEKEEEVVPKKEEPKKPVWLKQQKKSKKPNSKKTTRGPKTTNAPNVTPKNGKKEETEKTKETNETTIVKKPLVNGNESGDESEISNNEAEHSEDDSQNDKKGSSVEDDDTEWEKFQTRFSNREKALEGRSKMSHSVHCPFYPEDKQEYWWVYISDRKSRTLLTSPCHVTALTDREEVHLRFTAPRWPLVYTFTINLKSDSYLGFDQSQDMKLDVKEAPEVPTKHPQWDISDEDEEEPKEGNSDISEYTTDEDVEDV